MTLLNISIILPVINEAENLNYLIPRISQKLIYLNINYEILVVDDNSTDNTKEVVERLICAGLNVKHILRTQENSLPNSIFEGIRISKFDNVMWLDADGSMDENAIEKLIKKYKLNTNKVYIGSRFIEGGGYKGTKDNEYKNSLTRLNRILNSEDSVLAVLLSIVFNRLLNNFLKLNVKDLTSGFIIGKKIYFQENMFKNYKYGEYFISVIVNLYLKKVEMEEVGYYCLVRKFGKSKSSSNILKMVLFSKPYIFTAYNLRKKINENIR